jgi:hypothetical protein
MTAEERLGKHIDNGGLPIKENITQRQSVIEAMQEHAEQEAVEFAELLNENFVYVHNGLYRHVTTLQDYTITQIYQQFKQRNNG